MISVKELKIIFDKYGFRPRKKLGQNFLIDANIAYNIVNAADISKEDTVLEIGAGLGQLTESIAKKAKIVHAIEYDKLACGILKERLSTAGNTDIICGDILKLRIARLTGGKKIKVMSNLPYYITTPIIAKLIHDRKYISGIFITVQKELGMRFTARPGTGQYGAITCLVQFYTQPKFLFNISKKVFYPEPEVDSVFLALNVREEALVAVKDEALLFKIIRASFNQRRKTILNALTAKGGVSINKDKVSGILQTANIDPKRRGETLSLEEFAALANMWYN